MNKTQFLLVPLVVLGLTLAPSTSKAWVWTDSMVDPLYGCSDTLHPDDEDAPEHEWESISATGRHLRISSSDDSSEWVDLGFTFNFYEREYTRVSVSTNGFISFVHTNNGCCSAPTMPSTSDPDAVIALGWEDLYPGRGGNIYVQTVGEAGSRRFIMEYNTVQSYPSGYPWTVQIVLEEGTSNIYWHYLIDSDHGDTHVIGIENHDGTRGVQIYRGRMNAIDYNNQTIICSPLYLDQDGDGFGPEEDCDDDDPDINPDADEVCDGVDNDCDGEIDEGFDLDDDGFTSCGGDCDDTDDEINPEAVEVCNDIDDDCDDEIDEGFDRDDDGYTTCGGDCDDRDPDINPDGIEVCNEEDDDCDGEVDEGVTTTYYADFDRDGFGDSARTREACEVPPLHVENSDDCDDTSAAVNPGADEVCNDIDDDCDGEIDEGLLSTFWLDDDRDGYGDPAAATEACSRPARHVANSDDCDDTNRLVHPDAEELCDGIDNDCDGEIDDGAPTETFYADADGDGHGDPESSVEACVRPEGYVTNTTDCDDTDGTVYPGASEICDGIDNNCNDVVDEGVTTTFYADADGDGFGDPGAPVEACEAPEGAVENSDDCDDGDSAINPDAEELCDGIDNNCNGELDDGAPTETFYADGDGDGYGDPDFTVEACEAPAGYVDNAGDCDDTDAGVNPDATERCNEIDDDCNGEVDDGAPTETYYADSDGDGYGDPDSPTDSCGVPEGYTDDNTDCDDGDAEVHPNATEVDDDIDNDCDGEIDEGTGGGGGGGDDGGCSCSAAGANQGAGRAFGFIRLLLSWLGLF